MLNYFMVVENYENWLKTKETNFTVKAFKDGQSHKIIRSIKPGDIFVFYVSSGISALSGIAEVTSSLYTQKDLYWDDFYNLRFKIEPVIILEENKFVSFRELVEQLTFIKNKRKWANFVYHSIRIINTSDFHLMQTAIKKAKTASLHSPPTSL